MARLFHNGHLAITCNNACHLARGSAGGEDYATGVGTPVYAPFSGTWRWRVAGTGGWTFTGISSQVAGAVAECMHTSRSNGFVLGGASRFVAEGGLLGWSGGAKGAPGAGSSTGPHMHEHGIWAGIRQGISTFLAKFNSATAHAGGGVAPLPTETEQEDEDDMTTDLIYYATKASTDKDATIQAEEMWYQECPGAPLFPFSGGDTYANGAEKHEYFAFVNRHGHKAAYSGDYADARYPLTGDELLALIALRGVTAKPCGNFVNFSGNVTVPADPALLSAVQALAPRLDAVLAAAKALNPPG